MVGFAFISGGWKGGIGPVKGIPIGSVAEWSKALNLGQWVRIPLLPAVVLTKAGRPCVYLRKV